MGSPMTPAQLRAWFEKNHAGWNWDQRCAGAAYQVCVATGTTVEKYGTATAARMASTIVSRDVNAAPPGAFHFWEYWTTISGRRQNYGHVAASLGSGWALMSNPEAWDDQWGIVLGVTDVASWTARRRGIVTYLGWARTYGRNTANIISGQTAGSEDDMGTIDNTEENYQVIASFLQRALRYDVREQGLGPDWKLGLTLWEKIAKTAVTAEQVKTIADAVVAQIGIPKVTIDYAAIAKAVNDEAAKRLQA